jgi:hypothetical protein
MLLLVLFPFLAGMATGAIPSLVSLTTRHRRLFGCVSLTGGAVYLAGMTGWLSGAITLPLVLLGGALIGLAFHDRAPAGPRPAGVDHGVSAYRLGEQVTVDWERFDHLRARWASRQ